MLEPRELRDTAAAHADVDAPPGEAGPVDDHAAAHDEIEVGHRASAGANAARPVRTTRNSRPSAPAVKL